MQNNQSIAKGTRAFATCVTATAMAIAAVSALDRGGTILDQMLMIALYVAICAGTHFILAFSNHPTAWFLWICCMLGTVFVHLTFLTHANIRAGEVRAQHSVQKTEIERQIKVANETLATIKSRPIAVVADVLASSHDWRQRPALRAELAEAKRAAVLRDDLILLSATATTAAVVASNDPVVTSIAYVTGSSATSITLVVSLFFAILLELMGALLWRTALRLPRQSGISNVANELQIAHDPIGELRTAVDSGECPATVSGIRKFMHCGQDKALAIRRALLASKKN